MDSSEINLKETNDGLLSILKCPTCSDYIVPPIRMCSKWHICCAACFSKFPTCSTCKVKFTGYNYTMEKVAELVIYPCKYASAGCAAKLRVKDKKKHERYCLLRPLPCLHSGCKSESNISDYLQHLKETHPDFISVGTEDTVVRLLLSDQWIEMEVISAPPVLRNASRSEWVFSAFERFFLLKCTKMRTYTKFSTTRLAWKVICQGSMKEASKFYFTFSISDPKNPNNSMQFSCTPGSIEFEDLPGHLEDKELHGICQFVTPIDLLYPYRREDEYVPMKINIHKITEE